MYIIGNYVLTNGHLILALDVRDRYIWCYVWDWCLDEQDFHESFDIISNLGYCKNCLTNPQIIHVRKRIGAPLFYEINVISQILCVLAEEVCGQSIQPNLELIKKTFII